MLINVRLLEGRPTATELIDQLPVSISVSRPCSLVSFTSSVISTNLVCNIDQHVKPVFESLCIFTIYINDSLKVSVICQIVKSQTKKSQIATKSQSIALVCTYLLLQTVCYTPPEANQIAYFMSVVHNIAGNITVKQTVYYNSGLASILSTNIYTMQLCSLCTEFVRS